MVLIPLSIKDVYSPAGTVPLPSHLTSCTPTKSNLYLDSSLILSSGSPPYTDLYIPYSESRVLSASLASFMQRIRQSLKLIQVFVTSLFSYGEVLLTPRPKQQLEDHLLSFVRSSPPNILAVTLNFWRPSLHPEPEDAPWCGDKRTS
jgi:hypothetical protein